MDAAVVAAAASIISQASGGIGTGDAARALAIRLVDVRFKSFILGSIMLRKGLHEILILV